MGRFSFTLLLRVGVLTGVLATLAWTHNGVSQAGSDISDPAPTEDARTAIVFATEEREHIRSEMLTFLQGPSRFHTGVPNRTAY